MPQETTPSSGYGKVLRWVVDGYWPVGLVALALPVSLVAVGEGTLALATGATLLAAGHAFVVGIALGRGDSDVALALGSVTAVVVGVSAVTLTPLGALVFVVGSVFCLPAAALGYAAWKRT